MNSDADIRRDAEPSLRCRPDIDATPVAVLVKDGVVFGPEIDRPSSHHDGVRWAAALASIVLASCTTRGVGTGESPGGNINATFSWVASSATRGTMTAMLTTGQVYQGPFFQITQETSVDELGPLWTGWGGRWGWRGWVDWGPDVAWATKYSGRVLANLQGPGGYMRCRFVLASPSEGMAGGGQGRCQLPSGTIIQAQFPAR